MDPVVRNRGNWHVQAKVPCRKEFTNATMSAEGFVCVGEAGKPFSPPSNPKARPSPWAMEPAVCPPRVEGDAQPGDLPPTAVRRGATTASASDQRVRLTLVSSSEPKSGWKRRRKGMYPHGAVCQSARAPCLGAVRRLNFGRQPDGIKTVWEGLTGRLSRDHRTHLTRGRMIFRG